MIKEIKEVLGKYSSDNFGVDFEVSTSEIDGLQIVKIRIPNYNLEVEAQHQKNSIFTVCREDGKIFCVQEFTKTDAIEEVAILLVDASIKSTLGD